MKRVRLDLDVESAARVEGLLRAKTQAEGFVCLGCGARQTFSRWIIAHWVDSVQHTCLKCLATHKLKAGVVTLLTGPRQKAPRIIDNVAPASIDPLKPQFRAYVVFVNGVTSYRAVTDYGSTIDSIGDQAYDYACKLHSRRDKVDEEYRSLLRREEYPLLSTINVNGMIVGGGTLSAYGTKLDALRGQIYTLQLKEPNGRLSDIELTEADYKKLVQGWEENLAR